MPNMPNMPNIPEWEGPTTKEGTNYICYHKKTRPNLEQSVKEMKFGTQSIKDQMAQIKTFFIKINGSNISGGMINLGSPWEIVFESGKWIRYNLDLALTSTGDIAIKNGDRKLRKIGVGTVLDIDIASIQDMANWLNGQV